MVDEALSEYSRVNLSSDPIYRYLRITKGGPGGVPGEAAEQDLVDSAWLQRLRRIHQLQSAWWVFATAEHSRFQHALGAMHLAGSGRSRDIDEQLQVHSSLDWSEETMRSIASSRRRHGPFGHFFDENYLDTRKIDHGHRPCAIPPLAPVIGALGFITRFEPGERIDPRWVAYLISSAELEASPP